MTVADVLQQERWPVIVRPRRGDVLAWLPYAEDNRVFLRLSNSKPEWHRAHRKLRGYWSMPRTWFERNARRCAARWGQVYVVQPHNASEKCAPACWDARGLECACSCLGENHGSGHPGGRWYIISETCAVAHRGQQMRVSLLRPGHADTGG
jgi:hypothetical protein